MVFAVCVVVVVTAFGVTMEYGVDAEIMMMMLGGRVEVMLFVDLYRGFGGLICQLGCAFGLMLQLKIPQ